MKILLQVHKAMKAPYRQIQSDVELYTSLLRFRTSKGTNGTFIESLPCQSVYQDPLPVDESS